ncbi:MAG: MFS transporter, partial [Candidatus Bipolaricaulis sp.]|nr:MFS transporter [Candidatus Bipolaricaulis sp.]
MPHGECGREVKGEWLRSLRSQFHNSVVGLLALYLGSCFIRTFADSLFEMAVVWHIMRETGSTTMVGAIAATIQLPVTLAAPLAGVLADRWSRKALIVYSRMARAAVVSCVLLLYWMKVLGPWHLMAVGACDSFIQVLGGAAGTAVVPNLVGRENVIRANAWAEGANELAPILA